jgi:branched-chain amino acid transport system substrate-binding protein
MMREKHLRHAVCIALFLSLVGLGLVVPCRSSAQGSKDMDTLKVGSTLPLNLGMGVETKKMLEVIVPNFNQAGGITVKGKKVAFDLIIYDDKYSAEAGRAAVERLIYQDKVRHIICQIGSAPIVAGLSIAEQEKVLTLAGGASAKIVSPGNKYTFGTSTTRTSIPPLWLMAKRIFPKANTVVFISPDDETGKARAAEEKKVAEANGVKVLDVLYYARDTVDFSSIAARAKGLSPDVLSYPGAVAGTQFGLQMKAMHAAGFRGGQISAITPQMEEISAVASKEAIEGLLCKIPETDVPNPSVLAVSVKHEYMKKYGTWSEASLTWIPAWYAFIEAIKKTDSADPEVIANFMTTKGLQWDMPNGKAMLVKRPDLKNTQYTDTCSEQSYGQIKDGKLTFAGKVSLDDVVGSCEKVFGGAWK